MVGSGHDKAPRIAGLWNTYEEYLASREWREKRTWILECAGHVCSVCGTRLSVCLKCEFVHQPQLEVHHVSYERVGNEDANDVEVLCYVCHRLKHGNVEFKSIYCKCGIWRGYRIAQPKSGFVGVLE